MKLAIYGHGGSQNHGNEAIVRGIRELFQNVDLTVYTFSAEADIHFGLDDICNIKTGINNNIPFVLRVLRRVFPTLEIIKLMCYKVMFSPLLDCVEKDCIYLLEAGDQYCEPYEHREWYSYLNRNIKKRGAKTVMLGCTINPELFENDKMKKDLSNYDLIIARESITYDALVKNGIETRIVKAPCPAFAMKSRKIEVPEWIEEGNFIGINVGFLAQGNEKYYDILMRNYYNCIDWILNETKYDIALIPHVNWNYIATDYTELDKIVKKFEHNKRIHYVEEHNAPNQKYIISKCIAFVCLRTHATISALEMNVPTLITGYKTKSKGIAKDIYMDKFDVLADVQSLANDYVLRDKLKGLLKSREEIVDFSKDRMYSYLVGLDTIVESIIHLNELC